MMLLYFIISLKSKTEMEKYFTNINFVIQDHENYPELVVVMGIVPKYEKSFSF